MPRNKSSELCFNDFINPNQFLVVWSDSEQELDSGAGTKPASEIQIAFIYDKIKIF